MAWRAPEYVRYPKGTYATIQDGLLRFLAERQVGKNGWPVAVYLCRRVYADGRIGRASSKAIQSATGLTEAQVERGMRELRDKEIIRRMTRDTRAGAKVEDKAAPYHVARYEFTKEAWERIEKTHPGADDF